MEPELSGAGVGLAPGARFGMRGPRYLFWPPEQKGACASDNAGPKHKTGLVSSESSLISPDALGKQRLCGAESKKLGSDNETYIWNTEDAVSVDPADEQRKLISLIARFGGKILILCIVCPKLSKSLCSFSSL